MVCAGAPIEADRSSPAARQAAILLESRFFQPDKYPDRRAAEYWTRFTYPFQFTDLLTSLDSLGRMGFPPDDPDVARAVDWFRRPQRPDGSFALAMLRSGADRELPRWLGLAVCRALGRFAAR